MFVIELQYKADLSEIDAAMRPHVAYLKKHYAAGTFLVSGRKIPRDGGVILAVGTSREQIENIVREDPFVARGLADFRIIEFRGDSPLGCAEPRLPRSLRRGWSGDERHLSRARTARPGREQLEDLVGQDPSVEGLGEKRRTLGGVDGGHGLIERVAGDEQNQDFGALNRELLGELDAAEARHHHVRQ